MDNLTILKSVVDSIIEEYVVVASFMFNSDNIKKVQAIYRSEADMAAQECGFMNILEYEAYVASIDTACKLFSSAN